MKTGSSGDWVERYIAWLKLFPRPGIAMIGDVLNLHWVPSKLVIVNPLKQIKMAPWKQKDTKQKGLGPSSNELLGVYTPGVYTSGVYTLSHRFGILQPELLGVHILGAYTLGVYTLGVYSLGQPLLDLATHSLHWGSTLWGSTISGNRFWISQPTHWAGGLHFGGLESNEKRALGTIDPLPMRRSSLIRNGFRKATFLNSIPLRRVLLNIYWVISSSWGNTFVGVIFWKYKPPGGLSETRPWVLETKTSLNYQALKNDWWISLND